MFCGHALNNPQNMPNDLRVTHYNESVLFLFIIKLFAVCTQRKNTLIMSYQRTDFHLLICLSNTEVLFVFSGKAEEKNKGRICDICTL